MNELLDEVGDQRAHPLTGLLDAVASFVRDYEDEHVLYTRGPGAAVLKFLMDERGLDELDVGLYFNPPASVLDALAGVCPITARQARALAKGLGVPPAAFL